MIQKIRRFLRNLWMKRCKRFRYFIWDHLDICKPTTHTGQDKPASLFFDLYCYIFYPVPWQAKPCWCCAGRRGLLIGLVVGIFLGVAAGYFWEY